MGFVLSGMNFGLLVSPFLGGLIYEKLGYYAVFYTSFGVITFAFLWRLATIEQETAASWLDGERREEPRGTNFIDHEDTQHDPSYTTSTRSDERGQHDKGPTENTALLLDSPNPPTSRFARNYSITTTLLRSPRLKAAVYGSFTLFVLTTAFDGILPRFVIRTFSWKASGAGFIFLAITCPSMFGVVFGWLADRAGPKKVSLAGFGITTVSLGLLSLTDHNNVVSQVLLCVLLAFIGLPSHLCGGDGKS